MLKRIGVWFLAAVLLTAGCATSPQAPASSGTAGTQPAAAKTLKIGASVALTGGFAREGNLTKDGYEFWRDEVNAAGGVKVGNDRYKVEILFYDDKSDTQTATKLTEKLITEDNVQFILGPFSSAITQATTTIAEKYNAITIASLANAPSIYERGYKNVFSILPPATKYMNLLLDMAVTLDPKPKSVALLAGDEPFGVAALAGAKAKAQELGLQVVYEDKFPRDATDLSTFLTKIKAAKPDILLGLSQVQSAILITKQAKDLKVCPKMMAFSVGPATPDYQKALSADADYVYGSEWWLPNMGWKGIGGTSQDFAEKFNKAKGYSPGYHPAAAYMAGLLLQQGIERAGSLDVTKVRDAIAKFDTDTFWGPLAFDEKGQNRKGSSGPVQIQKGKVTAVWPASNREAAPQYPMPCWDQR